MSNSKKPAWNRPALPNALQVLLEKFYVEIGLKKDISSVKAEPRDVSQSAFTTTSVEKKQPKKD